MRRLLRYLEGTFDEFPWLWIPVVWGILALAIYMDWA